MLGLVTWSGKCARVLWSLCLLQIDWCCMSQKKSHDHMCTPCLPRHMYLAPLCCAGFMFLDVPLVTVRPVGHAVCQWEGTDYPLWEMRFTGGRSVPSFHMSSANGLVSFGDSYETDVKISTSDFHDFYHFQCIFLHLISSWCLGR